ncbi:MAG: N-acetyltransferase [Culturomica sp.]|jgi:predicted GNAT family acetyltransferase|nr:N-acetyltransferase [Culturomica sp.]
MEYTINHDKENHLFTTIVDNATAYVEYELYNNSMLIMHTIVPRRIEGRGVAAALVQAAYEYAKSENLQVTPVCSYAKAWEMRHPEYK